LVNFEGIKLVADYIIGVVDGVAMEDKLVFTKTKSTVKQGANFKVTLGVMPDYSNTEEGMKIDAVMEGRPAEKGGILDGDLIVQMDGKPIKDIYAYMEVLAEHKVGDTISVVVKRGDKEVETKVTF